MTDRISREHRSWNMSRIKSSNTKPEIMVRSVLHKAGFRFRKNVKDLPGKPDIVLPKYHTVIFVHGCFWHRHKSCRMAYTPKSRLDFWRKKFCENVSRDKENRKRLKKLGWDVFVICECEIEDNEKLLMNIF